MTKRLYLSTDAGAPVLTGQIGSLTALLDSILVNGYGTKDPAGWTIAFTAENKRAYRMGIGTSQRYFRIDDTGGINPRAAVAKGYNGMTSIDAGTFEMSVGTQSIILKSITEDGAARPWAAIAWPGGVYLMARPFTDATYLNMAPVMAFVDLDAYQWPYIVTAIGASPVYNLTPGEQASYGLTSRANTTVAAPGSPVFFPRNGGVEETRQGSIDLSQIASISTIIDADTKFLSFPALLTRVPAAHYAMGYIPGVHYINSPEALPINATTIIDGITSPVFVVEINYAPYKYWAIEYQS